MTWALIGTSQGVPGAQGPAGATGPQGPQGPAGTLPTPQVAQKLTDTAIAAGAGAVALQTLTFTPSAAAHLFVWDVYLVGGSSGEAWYLWIEEDGTALPKINNPTHANVGALHPDVSVTSEMNQWSEAFFYTPTNASHTYTLMVEAGLVDSSGYTVKMSQLAIL